MGQHNSPKTSNQAHPSFMHSNPAGGLGRPSIPHGTTAPAFGYTSGEITPGIDSVPRQASMHAWPPSMPGMPAPGIDANGMAMPRMSAFGSERAPMQGVPMAISSTNTGIPAVHGMPSQPMQAQGHASPFPATQQAQPGFGTSAGTTASGGYQFPNPFDLEHGPHVPGFGNGFTLQQMPSLMGQIGAHFQMPRGMQYGMTKSASPRPHYGF